MPTPESTPELPQTAHGHDEATLTSSLESLDNALNYRDWIVSLCTPHLGQRILEIGAGHGTFTDVLRQGRRVWAVEPDTSSWEVLNERFETQEEVTVIHGVTDDVSAADFSSAIMVNVLEHIEDEGQALQEIHDRLADEGRLILWVPAFQLLFSKFDHKLGHHRRYRKAQLESVVAASGFDVVESQYVNLPGWFSWLLMVRILRLEPTGERTVRLFDRVIVPVVRAFEQRIRVPFGQSVFLVARKQSRPPRNTPL